MLNYTSILNKSTRRAVGSSKKQEYIRSSLKGNIEKECLCGAVEVVEEKKKKKIVFAILLVYTYIQVILTIDRVGGCIAGGQKKKFPYSK